MPSYDILHLGPVSDDYNYEPDGSLANEMGGAITYSPFAAEAAGARVAILAKAHAKYFEQQNRFVDLKAQLYPLLSETMTSIENRYLDASHETRISSMRSQASPFTLEELPRGVEARIYHLGGLIYGDFPTAFILGLAERGAVALDAQCVLRHGNPLTGEMSYEDWVDKKKVFPHLRYLKVDAKEAECLTGEKKRLQAAKRLHDWGAQEVFLSYHEEMLVYDGKSYFHCAYQPKSLAGRTGRGDTVFAAYLARRLREEIPESLVFATALVSMKMEKIGPFLGNEKNVKNYIQEQGLFCEQEDASEAIR